MTWKVTDVVSQRIEFVVRAISGKESVSQLCHEYGISRQTGHLWLKRYRENRTFTALEDRSHAPVHVRNRSARYIEDRVIQLRRLDGWAGRKIQQVLETEDGIRISARTVDRILKREGCIDKEDQNRPALRRYERQQPNELWQMDFKGQYPTDQGDCFPLTVLDDHSRYVLGLYALSGTGTEGVRNSLIHAFQNHGLPDQILTDHGTPWWNVNSCEDRLTQIGVLLIKQAVKLSFSGVGHPQTQGKVERFHRTMARSILYRGQPRHFSEWQATLDGIRETYNHRRPHEALGMKVPASSYSPNRRLYNPKPAEWIYPPDWTVTELNGSGNLQYCGRQYFVSKAIAREPVAFKAVDSKLLVRFRHMYVREIDLERRETYALIAAVLPELPVKTV
jgi:transposase InsO family protein